MRGVGSGVRVGVSMALSDGGCDLCYRPIRRAVLVPCRVSFGGVARDGLVCRSCRNVVDYGSEIGGTK